MESSKAWRLNQQDITKWVNNFFIFCSPAIIIFLTTLQTGGDWRIAQGALYQAILASSIDLFQKLKSGVRD